MSKTVVVYSMEEIEAKIRDIVKKDDVFMIRELEKLRERMQQLEQLISIYDGKLKIIPKNSYGKSDLL